MAKCKLCIDKDISEVKSHIITDAIIRSAVYLEGRTKRGDYEAMGTISLDELGYTYFGSSVLPENREQLLGYVQDEIELEKTRVNPFINDQLVCFECEARFQPIEAEFISKIYEPLMTNKVKLSAGMFEFKNNLPLVSLGFILINVWRASASKFSDWFLPIGDEERIRQVLNNCLGSNLSQSLQCLHDNKDQLRPYKYHLSFLEQTEGLATENLISIDEVDNPYYFHINRLTFFLSIDSFTSITIPKYLESVYDKIKLLEITSDTSLLKIGHVSNEQRVYLIKSFLERLSKNLIRHTIRTFISGFHNFFGSYPNATHMQYLFGEIESYIQSTKSITIYGIINAMAKALDNIFREYASH